MQLIQYRNQIPAKNGRHVRHNPAAPLYDHATEVARYSAGTPAYPGATNVHQPVLNPGMILEFTRNEADFKVNQYMKLTPVDRITDLYARFGDTKGAPEEAGRIVLSDTSDYLVNDGNDFPSGEDEGEKFQLVTYNCERYIPSMRIGKVTVENADWDLVEQQTRILMQKAMTIRTQLTVTELTTSGNYDSNNTSDVTSITGVSNQWDAAVSTNMDIKKSINYGLSRIKLTTLGAIKADDCVLVVGDDLARAMGTTQEMVDIVKQSPMALEYISADGKWRNQEYGLPDRISGVKIVIEDAVKITSRKGATRAPSFVLGSDNAILMARPGALYNSAGPMSREIATGTIFSYSPDELRTKIWYDEENERYKIHVIDNFDVQLSAPSAAFLFTDCHS